jgi:preprotein translocase subunit SecD
MPIRLPHKLQSSLLALLLLMCVTFACSYLPRPSRTPQDRGGFYLILAVKADASQLAQSVEQTMAVIKRRCDQLEIYCKLQPEGGDHPDRIMMRVSSPMETARVKSILLAEGLELRAVVSPSSPAPVQSYATKAEAINAAGPNADVLPYLESLDADKVNTESFIVVERIPIVTGQDIRNAEAVSSRSDGADDDYQIAFTLNSVGAERFGRWTAANINHYLAIVLNKRARSVAYIRSQITDSGEINGRFTRQQAEDIALVLKSGNLPAPVEVLEEGTYKP